MKRPVRTTIVYAFASGAAFLPLVEMLNLLWPSMTALKIALWATLAPYSVLLTRWSGRSPAVLLLPLGIVLGAALWPQSHWGFFATTVTMLALIRSGLCFNHHPLRALMAESITLGGAIALTLLFSGATPLAWALMLLLFILVQAFYFFLIPFRRPSDGARADLDPFASAVDGLQRMFQKLP